MKRAEVWIESDSVQYLCDFNRYYSWNFFGLILIAFFLSKFLVLLAFAYCIDWLTALAHQAKTKTFTPFFQTRQCNTPPCVGWSSWSEFGLCSVTCGTGFETRTRTCLPVGTPSVLCGGPAQDTRPCFQRNCDFWGQWSFSGPCSQSCGVGTRPRMRECIGKYLIYTIAFFLVLRRKL